MSTEKRYIVDDYLDYHRDLVRKYGPNSVVLLQNGSFFEIYNYRCPDGPDLYGLSDLLNIQISRKDKNIIEVSRKNFEMAGFPLWAKAKFVQMLLNAGYTVAVYLQHEVSKGKFVREVDEIISPSTNLDYLPTVDNNYLASIYFETNQTVRDGRHYQVGASFIDLSTGVNYLGESGSLPGDFEAGLDWIYNSLKLYNPREVVIYLVDEKGVLIQEKIDSHLELTIDGRTVHWNLNTLESKYTRLSYQNEFLARVFTNNGILQPIENLGLERYTSAITSYLVLLEFAKSHKTNIIEKINQPIIIQNEGRLLLTLNSIYQLGLVADQRQTGVPSQRSCLLNLLNGCQTAMGKRRFKYQLLNPITNVGLLEAKYSNVDFLREGKRFALLKPTLQQIFDIERLHRRLTLKILSPNEFYNLHKSNLAIESLVQQLKNLGPGTSTDDNVVAGANQMMMPSELHAKFLEYCQFYNSYLLTEEVYKYNLGAISRSCFVRGRFPEIDQLDDEIVLISNKFITFANQLSLLIEGREDTLNHDSNDREGHFLTTTNKRAATLKAKLGKTEWTFLYQGTGSKYNLASFTFKSGASSTKIFHNAFKEWGEQSSRLKQKMCALANTRYLEILEGIDTHYRGELQKVGSWVAEIDCLKTHAENAFKYRLTRPKPVLAEPEELGTFGSFLHVEEIRHLLVEQLQPQLPFVTNDVFLGPALNSVTDSDNQPRSKDLYPHNLLCYGYNAVGKTTLQKSLALAIIMAQAGGFVAAKSMTFRPFHQLFTRISNVDNLLKGQSSYMVEMLELKYILKHANNRSFICIDELVASTESFSGLSTVVATLELLHQKGACLFMATHLHDLAKMDRVTRLPGLVIKHLEVNYDEKEKLLVYDRKLKDGSGSGLYGLEVAKYLDLPNDFLKLAFEVRNELLDDQHQLQILPTKSSNYNQRIVVDQCQICQTKEQLHTHHINFQCNADQDGYFETFHKNVDHNLVVLCQDCHHKVHQNEITVKGWRLTNNGRNLDFSVVSPQKSSQDDATTKNDLITEDPIEEKGSATDVLVTEEVVSKASDYSPEILGFVKGVLQITGERRGFKKIILDRLDKEKGVKLDYRKLNTLMEQISF